MTSIAISDSRLKVYEAMREIELLSPGGRQDFKAEMERASRVAEGRRADWIRKNCLVTSRLKAAALSEDEMKLLLKVITTFQRQGMRAAILLLADNPAEVPAHV